MKLIIDWRRLHRMWSVQVAALGLALPELLQLLADQTHLLQWFDDGMKSTIRLACLGGVIVLRAIKQGGDDVAKNQQ